ncbi:MAG: protein-L-isoaspartate(D-aspartate) O-methyltransferase, partial [Acidobacteria bacterium]
GVMRELPRHLFVEEAMAKQAYMDNPLPIGEGQTISQPYIVALMTELAGPLPSDKALEIGTGCGYQTAILSRMASQVYSIEIVQELSREAAARLSALGCGNVRLSVGDGRNGLPAHAPFDVILSGAAPEAVPPALIAQLAQGGRLVIPAGPSYAQQLLLLTKDESGHVRTRAVTEVRFVPLIGDG